VRLDPEFLASIVACKNLPARHAVVEPITEYTCMLQKLICLFVLTAALTTAQAASTEDVGPTLTIRKTADGLIVDAVRQYAGRNQQDTTGLIPGETSLGAQWFKLRFKGCGEVKFIHRKNDHLDGISAGRGTTPQCQIKNWEVQWAVLHTES